MRKTIKLAKIVGDFAENKDKAKMLRTKEIIPALQKGYEVVIDFEKISGATQSFIHALISEPIRSLKDIAFEKLLYKNTNKDIQAIISIVYRYMQESLDGPSEIK
jgi:hypothetical protein